MTELPPFTIAWHHHCLNLGPRTCIMGILNITPDSFSDGGRFFNPDSAIQQALRLQEQGADILDIGGESARPFSDPVTEAEEIRRVVPVIEAIAGQLTIPISIDTCKSSVARQALDAGASIINDISALRMDSRMAALAAERDIPVILMHMLGTPRTMQVSPVYVDLIGEIREFLQTAIDGAVNQGISRTRLIVDPGIGFGKTIQHNLTLINRLKDFEGLNLPILMGPSRKSFIRNILKQRLPDDRDPNIDAVETGTQVALVASILNGAHIVRVHDVARARITADIADALKKKG
jgi:dihydropteroate synthase